MLGFIASIVSILSKQLDDCFQQVFRSRELDRMNWIGRIRMLGFIASIVSILSKQLDDWFQQAIRSRELDRMNRIGRIRMLGFILSIVSILSKQPIGLDNQAAICFGDLRWVRL